METWKPVPEHPDYEVSDLGRVRSWKNNRHGRAREPRLLKPSRRNRGYVAVNLDTSCVRFIHHLVLEAFIGPRPKGTECAHFNGVVDDNRLTNLRWATPLENGRDNARLGVSKGERHGSSKLTEAAVRDIRSSGERTAVLAARYGVAFGTVCAARARRSWVHVS